MAEITVQIQDWLLTDAASMATCLEDMSGNNFRGIVRVQPEFKPVDAAPDWVPANVWDMELNDNNYLDRPPITAVPGQVVVFFGGVAQVMSPEDYAAQYGEAR